MPNMIEPEVGTKAIRYGGPFGSRDRVVTVESLTRTLIVTDDGQRYRKSDHRNRSSSMHPYHIAFEGEDDYAHRFHEAERAKWRRAAQATAREVLDNPTDPDVLKEAAGRFASLAARWERQQ